MRFDFPPALRATTSRSSTASASRTAKVIYDGLDLLIRLGERWCVMGVNGAGKSTLLKLVVRRVPNPTRRGDGRGEREAGLLRAARDGAPRSREDRLGDDLGRVPPRRRSARSARCSAGFGFSGDDVEKPCRVLSGGEKARLVLARMLYDPPNFLVLDEPTNHLDMDTKEMLVEALGGYEGTMLFVSHDRRFLGALSNRVLELTPEGACPYGGGYQEYVAQSGPRGARLAGLNRRPRISPGWIDSGFTRVKLARC